MNLIPDMQLERAHEKAALAETTVREAVASEMEELLRDMESGYRVCICSPDLGNGRLKGSERMNNTHTRPSVQERLAAEAMQLERKMTQQAACSGILQASVIAPHLQGSSAPVRSWLLVASRLGFGYLSVAPRCWDSAGIMYSSACSLMTVSSRRSSQRHKRPAKISQPG